MKTFMRSITCQLILLEKLLFLCIVSFFTIFFAYGSFRFATLQDDSKIMHALGAIDAVPYTNSREAFELYLSKGKHHFEVDLALTTDNRVVAYHGKLNISYREFMAKRILGKYSPLSFDDLLNLMERHKDVVVILDTKDEFSRIFPLLTSEIREKDPLLQNRIVPQIYQPADLQVLESTGFIGGAIYTLYKISSTDDEVLRFVSQHPQIKAVTMSIYRFSWQLANSLSKLGRRTYVHTVNHPLTIIIFLGLGAYGIYTDEG